MSYKKKNTLEYTTLRFQHLILQLKIMLKTNINNVKCNFLKIISITFKSQKANKIIEMEFRHS